MNEARSRPPKTFGGNRPWGPWVMLYQLGRDLPDGVVLGLMISTGSRDIAISGGTRRNAVLIGWHFAKPHRAIGDATREWHWEIRPIWRKLVRS